LDTGKIERVQVIIHPRVAKGIEAEGLWTTIFRTKSGRTKVCRKNILGQKNFGREFQNRRRNDAGTEIVEMPKRTYILWENVE
jgi:hypothetical protein